MDDEMLDREEFSSLDDVQLLADRPVAGKYLMLAQQVDGRCAGRTLPQE
jgi:hypothetical protein